MAETNKPAKKVATDLPHNASAEQAVLGSAILNVDALYKVLSKAEENDFYIYKHQIIYRAIRTLNEEKIAVDVLTLTEKLMNMKELDTVGGVDYLQTCCDSMVALSSLDFYLNIVIDQSVLRNLIVTAREINQEYVEREISDINEFIVNSQAKFDKAIEKRRIAGFKGSTELAHNLELRMSKPIDTFDGHCTGVSSGYDSIDRYTLGFHPGDMIIIAARPSVGKTALALNMAYNVASSGKPVAIFSLEMSNEQLMDRMLGIASNVNLTKISKHDFSSDREKAKISSTIKELSKTPIFIDDTSGIKLLDIVANTRRLQAEHKDLALVIVDYLSLVTSTSTGKNDSRQDEVRRISLALKGMAKELKIPVIVVSQLSRNVENRGDNKRPMLSDLRESGSIEQDADVVMLLYREDYYKGQKGANASSLGDKKLNEMTDFERFEAMKTTNANAQGSSLPGDASLVEVNVAKNRNGQTGIAQLFFFKEYGRFSMPTQEWIEQSRALREGK